MVEVARMVSAAVIAKLVGIGVNARKKANWESYRSMVSRPTIACPQRSRFGTSALHP